MGRYLCNGDWIDEEREKTDEQNAGRMEEYLRVETTAWSRSGMEGGGGDKVF